MKPKDEELIEAARAIISKRFKQDAHHIGAALRSRTGVVYAAVHLEAYVGRVAVCAEAVAIGMAAANGDSEIETIVAVNRDGHIVSPCGMCRELIYDYSPEASVIILESEGPAIASISQLLPLKYRRT